jgi:hypothetical protein
VRRRLRSTLGPACAVLLLVGGCAAAAAGQPTARWSVPGPAIEDDNPSGAPSEPPSPSPSPTPKRSPTPKASASRVPGATPNVLATYGFTFTVAPGGTGIVGTGGTLLRYEVAVQTGLSESPAQVAATVDSVLGNAERGWLRGGQWRFQRVSGGSYDFVVELATPSTTDTICGKYGISTQGQVSCRGQKNVVINSARWERGTNGTTEGASAYPPDVYRILAINHEVGHALGHGHVTCPGEGKKAPVMQTQYFGLNGCVQNVWPYEPDGSYLD